MKLLFTEDEVELSRAVCVILRHQGNEVDLAYDGEEALRKAHAGSYDCTVMDVVMPRQDGISMVWTLRTESNRTPVITLTAKIQLENKITGFDVGADDYLTEPFATWELLAQIRSMARHSGYQEECIQAGNMTLNMGEQEPKTLSSTRIGSKEVRLMKLFTRNPNKLLGGEEFSWRVWGESEESGDEQLLLYILYLYQKLGAIQADLLIEGERGGSLMFRQRDI